MKDKAKNLLHLMRVKHYIKNGLIFVPAFFGGKIVNIDNLWILLGAFIAFSLIASVIYIINDINDIEKDRLHKTKKNRPLASGVVSVNEGLILALALAVISLTFLCSQFGFGIATGALLIYFVVNILYSVCGLKNVPIIDVTILSIGFILRVVYGAAVINVEVSKWLYLTIFAFSFYMGLGKRRNELTKNGSMTRTVNKYYTKAFLDKNMYMCLSLCIVFYSLWTIDPLQEIKGLIWTVPLMLIIFINYSLCIESGESEGDPINVFLDSTSLKILVISYICLMYGLIYIL